MLKTKEQKLKESEEAKRQADQQCSAPTPMSYGSLERQESLSERIQQKVDFHEERIKKLYELQRRVNESRCEVIAESIKSELEYL